MSAFHRAFAFERQPWRDDAACVGVDPDLFFPGRGEPTREAKEVCAGCPVRQPCLDWSLANNEKFGLWGGLSERERRRIRTARAAERAAAASPAEVGPLTVAPVRRKHGHRYGPDVADEIKQRRAAGQVARAVARDLGVSVSTVYYHQARRAS